MKVLLSTCLLPPPPHILTERPWCVKTLRTKNNIISKSFCFSSMFWAQGISWFHPVTAVWTFYDCKLLLCRFCLLSKEASHHLYNWVYFQEKAKPIIYERMGKNKKGYPPVVLHRILDILARLHREFFLSPPWRVPICLKQILLTSSISTLKKKILDLTLSRVSGIYTDYPITTKIMIWKRENSVIFEPGTTSRAKKEWLQGGKEEEKKKMAVCSDERLLNFRKSSLSGCVAEKFNSWSHTYTRGRMIERKSDWRDRRFPFPLITPIDFSFFFIQLKFEYIFCRITWKKFRRNCRRPAAATWRRERHSGRWRHLTLRETIPLEICNVSSLAWTPWYVPMFSFFIFDCFTLSH